MGIWNWFLGLFSPRRTAGNVGSTAGQGVAQGVAQGAVNGVLQAPGASTGQGFVPQPIPGQDPSGWTQQIQQNLTNWWRPDNMARIKTGSYPNQVWSALNGSLYNQAQGNPNPVRQSMGWVPATMAGAALAGLSLMPSNLSQHEVTGLQGLFTKKGVVAMQAGEVGLGQWNPEGLRVGGPGQGTTKNGWQATWDKIYRDASGKAVGYEGLKWTKGDRVITADRYNVLKGGEDGWAGVRYGNSDSVVDRIRRWQQDGKRVYAGTAGFASGFGGANRGWGAGGVPGSDNPDPNFTNVDEWTPVETMQDFNRRLPDWQRQGGAGSGAPANQRPETKQETPTGNQTTGIFGQGMSLAANQV